MLARTHIQQRAFQAHRKSNRHASSVACRAVAAPAKVQLKAAGTTQGVEFAPLINVSGTACISLLTCHVKELPTCCQ
jgi:hypothetical protein